MSGQTPVFDWHETLWERPQQLRRTGRLPHALLLAGLPGVGKLQLANRLAAQLLCREPGSLGACGECQACHLLDAGSHPDIRRTTPEGESRVIRIDSVRALTEFIGMKSQYGGYKIAIIHPADRMNRNAANSLLKTLEEPPEKVLLILVADRASLLPATIRSRCQQMAVAAPSREQAVSWLEAQAPELAAQAALLLPFAGGAPLRALRDAEQGVPEKLERLASQLGDTASGRLGAVDAAASWPKEDQALLLELLTYLVQQLVRNDGDGTVLTPPVHLPSRPDPLMLHGYVDYLYRTRGLSDRSLNPQLAAEDLFVRWVRLNRQAGTVRASSA
ncbi:MAG: DNA polymerase III subunit delta' [Ectothiorhodospiraceae bacterium]|nr:DNA polymerase III subunit delta' [Ectothiorhodospiraceae bacterium]